MFSCLSLIDSLDSLEAFRFHEQRQTAQRQRSTTTEKGITRPTVAQIVILTLLPSFFESHATDVHLPSSPQHCPVEQSSFV